MALTYPNLNETDIASIEMTWELINEDRLRITELFYNKLFDLAPDTKKLFKTGILDQGSKLTDFLNFVVMYIREIDGLTLHLKFLGMKHKGYRVKKKHYPVYREALLWSFRTGLGKNWSEDAENAWEKVHEIMSSTMILGSMGK